MKVFISCSGARSRAIAKALRDWLRLVIQALEPWMFEDDIEKGARWQQEIGQELEQTKCGIICLTPENLNAPWINFEAGALSKTIEKTLVCTYLLDLKATDVVGPLNQFNATRVEKEETKKLLRTLNRALDDRALPEQELDTLFEALWPRLEDTLNSLPAPESGARPERPPQEMIEEILGLVRSMSANVESWGREPTLPTQISYEEGKVGWEAMAKMMLRTDINQRDLITQRDLLTMLLSNHKALEREGISLPSEVVRQMRGSNFRLVRNLKDTELYYILSALLLSKHQEASREVQYRLNFNEAQAAKLLYDLEMALAALGYRPMDKKTE